MKKKTPKSYVADQMRKSVLLLPAVLLLLLFFIVPVILTVYYSFTNMALTGSAAKNFTFVGLQNYARMVKDRTARTAILNTLIFLVGSLIGQQFIGFILAYFMKDSPSGLRRVVGPCILAGWVMPEVVVSLCMLANFDVSGTVNAVLGLVNIPAVSWIYGHPMLTIILANVWHGTAFSMMNFQSAMDSVSGDLEEAARVDGATRTQSLFRIIIPCIKDTIGMNTMLNTLSTLGVFGLIWAMTGGGPGNKTTVLTIYMYNSGMKNFQLGQGTAIGILILLVGAICGVIYAKMMNTSDK